MESTVVEWEHLTNVERTCLGVAFARWHASATGTVACKWPDGTPWYSDPLGPLFVVGIPRPIQQEMEEVRLKGESWMRLFCAVRTAEIDQQIASALAASPDIRQMVLLGAGMDTRAWRLKWPDSFSVFEVDSQQVLDFKHMMLRGGGGGAGTTAEQQQQQEEADGRGSGLPELSCERRVPVVADASKAQDLWTKLLSGGLSASTPTLYVLEGFIGYLERDAGNALLQQLSSSSAPGSRIIVTAPPTLAERARGHDAAIAEAAAAKNAANGAGAASIAAGDADSAQDTTAAAAAGADRGSGNGGVVGVQVGPDGVRTYRPRLHHSTFEEPIETLARLSSAGWSDCRLLTAEELGAKYGAPTAQPILLGSKP